jgi:nitrogenase molybdenum-iron protein beta chain
VCTDPLQADEQQRLTDGLSGLDSGYEANLVFETDASQVIHHLREKWPAGNGGTYHNAFSPAFVVGSSLERELAQTLGAGHLSVSFPVANRAVIDRGYTGFRGGLRLTEDLISSIVAGR